MKYAYYPGCSSENLTSAYESSLQGVAALLGLELEVIPDWSCCGATEYSAVDRLASYAIAARNLALAPAGCTEVVTSCSACFLNLQRVEAAMSSHPGVAAEVNEALAAGSLAYEPGRLAIRHILEVFVNDLGLDFLKAHVRTPLSHLRIAPYYGCMLVRPLCRFDQPEYPVAMDRLFHALGARVADFSLRGYCCGGHLPQIKATTGFEILHRILKNARSDGADLIAVACPVCQLNLDLYQRDVNERFGTAFDFPVLFFTQVMGLAFGLDPRSLGIGREIVSAERLLAAGPSPGQAAAGQAGAVTMPLPMPVSTTGEKR